MDKLGKRRPEWGEDWKGVGLHAGHLYRQIGYDHGGKSKTGFDR